MKKIKVVSLLMVLTLVMVFSAVSMAEEQIVLKVATWGSEALEQIHIPAFEKLHPNVKIEPIVTDINDHHTTLLTKLAANAEVPDVAYLEVQYVGTIAARGGFVDLSQPPYNANEFKDKVVPYTFAQVTTSDGKLVAFPTDIAPATIFYRKDRLDELGVNIDEIKTMQDWIEVGFKFSQDTDGDGKYDQWLMANAGHIFEMYRRSAEERFFDKDGNVIVDQPQFIKGMKLAQRVRDLALDGQIDEWTNDWYAALREGKVLIQPSGAWLAGHLKNWICPDTAGKWRAANLPEGMNAFWGGSFAGIPEGAKHKELAWEFIKMVSLDKQVQLDCFDYNAMFPALLSTYGDPLFDQPNEFLGGQQARKMWADVALNVPEVITNKNDRVAQEIVSTALAQVLDNGRDPEEALLEAKRLIERRASR